MAEQSSATENETTKPTQFCDIVMKGGITSGVVYPTAVCELAGSYHFKSIGGTSAGAIAAALTAAAEHARAHGSDDGFRELGRLSEWLGADAKGWEGSNLSSFFQPQSSTRGIFRVATSVLGRKGLGMVWALIKTLLLGFPIGTVIGILLALGPVLMAITSGSGVIRGWGFLSGGIMLLLLPPLFAALLLLLRAKSAIPKNFYGICAGSAGPPKKHKTKPGPPLPLTDWLADHIDLVAGKSDAPLTFGDLLAEDVGVDLQMMTTSLSHGRPYRIPEGFRGFYFDPATFRRFFPERIVTWMEDHPPAPPAGASDRARWELELRLVGELKPFPDPENIPVVVATRFSLSFPVLLSAVPIHSIDRTRTFNIETATEIRNWLKEHEEWEAILHDPVRWKKERKGLKDFQAERCWFSDGGLSSNFPLHFFDRPLPRWPTFGINLSAYHPDHDDGDVWMATGNLGGIANSWNRFDAGGGSLFGFFGAMLDAMKDWHDNTLMRTPGYRDRVVHIHLNDVEGGLNLNMPKTIIESLGERGKLAGKRLKEHFAEGAPGWDNHRWVRYRSSMDVIETMLKGMAAAYDSPLDGDRSYEALILRRDHELPDSYRWKNGDQMAFGRDATGELMDLARRWSQSPQHFNSGAPRPTPELRIAPRI